jgi:hypothetical protein
MRFVGGNEGGNTGSGSNRINFVSPHQHYLLSAVFDGAAGSDSSASAPTASGEQALASLIDNPVMAVKILNEIDVESLHRSASRRAALRLRCSADVVLCCDVLRAERCRR